MLSKRVRRLLDAPTAALQVLAAMLALLSPRLLPLPVDNLARARCLQPAAARLVTTRFQARTLGLHAFTLALHAVTTVFEVPTSNRV